MQVSAGFLWTGLVIRPDQQKAIRRNNGAIRNHVLTGRHQVVSQRVAGKVKSTRTSVVQLEPTLKLIICWILPCRRVIGHPFVNDDTGDGVRLGPSIGDRNASRVDQCAESVESLNAEHVGSRIQPNAYFPVVHPVLVGVACAITERRDRKEKEKGKEKVSVPSLFNSCSFQILCGVRRAVYSNASMLPSAAAPLSI